MSRKDVFLALLLCALTFGVFSPILKQGFIRLDDQVYVTENSHVRNGINANSLEWAFTSMEAGNWHPLTWVSHMVDCQLFGLSPRGHHFTGVLFHSLNSALLFLFLLYQTGRRWPSLAVAALFALHPMHVESVAWVSERKDVLSTFFWILTLWSYASYSHNLKRSRYLVTIVLFVLAILSKPMVVTLPIVMLLMDFWPLKRIGWADGKVTLKKILIEKIPFAALTLGSCILTFLAQSRGGAVASTEQVSLSVRLANIPASYMDYCQKLLWPSHLCIFYPIHQQIDWSRTVINIVCLVAITAAAFAMRKIFPAGIVGWLYFLVTLVPVIGLVQVGGQAMADRYSYIPSIGFFIVLIWGLCLVADRNRVFGKIAFAIVIAIVVGLAAATTQQIGHWKSSVSLFQHALDVTHENAQATIFLGDSMIQEGNVDAGLKLLNDAAKERPNSGEIHGRIAKTLAGIGRIEESEAEYHAALVLEPNLVEALNNLAWMLATSTDAKNRNGAEAVTLALHSCELTRYRMPIHIGTLAAAYAEAGRFAEAIKSGEQARDLARSQGDEAVAQTNEQLLSLYREGKAYHPAQ